MTGSIYGYQQEQLLQYVDEVKDSHGKMKVIQLDCVDLCIMRWLANFIASGKMKHKTDDNGNLLYALTYNKVLTDLPFIRISKRALYDRFKKMEHFGIVETVCDKDKTGTHLYIRFLDNYYKLSYQKTQGDAVQTTGGMVQTAHPGWSKLPNKDNKLDNKELNNIKKNSKKKVTEEEKLEW